MQNSEYAVVLQKISVDVSSILTRLSHEVYVVILGGCQEIVAVQLTPPHYG